MKITVLGSSGQIGTYLTKHLRDRGHDVIEFDVVRSQEEDLTTIPNPRLERVIRESDFVFFLAFDVGGSRYLKKYQHTFPFIDNNARMMANVFGLLQQQHNKKFIFASSQMSNMTYSPYGVLKSVGELYTKTINGLTVKFWNVYGIENDHEKFHVITDFIHKGLKTGVIDMLTDGQEERDFLYAEDCCEALEVIMNKYDEFTCDDNLHITSFKSTKIVDVASIIADEFKSIGKDVRVVPSEQKDTVQMDKRNQPDTYLSKWWIPKTTIKDGIKKVFEAVIKN